MGLGGALLAGCGLFDKAPEAPAPGTPAASVPGDGSAVVSGPQPRAWTPERIRPGERPPQFVVLSWDGAGTAAGTFARVRQTARLNGATMTFFLSGLHLLPERQRDLYRPPHRPAGASRHVSPTDAQIRDTILNLGLAWREGNEIGAQVNGRRCAGVRRWTAADWKSEIEQSVGFVGAWKTHTGFTDLPPLPFDPAADLAGGRAPCPGGPRALRKAARQLGWKYDAGGTGRQVWPHRDRGLWRLPVQTLPLPGRAREVRGTDLDLLRVQVHRGRHGSAHLRPRWRKQAGAVLQAGFERAYRGNRAPLIVGTHLAHWNGGIYLEAVQELLTRNARRPDVRFVSYRQLVEWLELQDPAVLARLRALPVGKAPARGWPRYLAPASPAADGGKIR
ncbi:hypothetical protein GCM10022221_36760 [Actinocorallia aurea]